VISTSRLRRIATSLVLSACISMAQSAGIPAPVRILLITGGHPYEESTFTDVFNSMKTVTFTHVELGGEAEKKLKPEEAQKYDVLVFYDMYQHCEPYLSDLQSLMEQGKGVVFLHHALGSCSEDLEHGYMVGGKARFDAEDPKATLSRFKAGTSYRAHIEDPDNPITAGMSDFDVADEVYSNYFVDTDSHVFLTTDYPNSGHQLAWTSQYKKSRVVYIQLGHDHVTYENSNYRKLVERSILWVSGRLTTPTTAKVAPGERPEEGAQLYAGLGCAACHGEDARGGRGPDLRSQALWSRSDAQQHVFDTIKRGVKGTEMPSFAGLASEQDIRNLVSFLGSFQSDARTPIVGNVNHGQQVFQSAGCAACHGPAGRGGVLGPDLAPVIRSKGLDYLKNTIRQPAKSVPFNYAAVSVITQEGERITGRRCNEDTFSLQIVDHSGNMRLFLKDELQKITYEQKPLMPTYDEIQLPQQSLLDTLAYLQSLLDHSSL